MLRALLIFLGLISFAQAELPTLFVATKAFIRHGEKILVLRESIRYAEGTQAGNFDVVEGRLTPGERYDACLLREVKEETGLDVKIGSKSPKNRQKLKSTTDS